jgi:hypothetical protein
MILTTSQLDQVRKYQSLIAQGKSAAESARTVGVSPSTIRGWLTKGENLAAPPKAPAKKAAVKKPKAVKDAAAMAPAKKATKKASKKAAGPAVEEKPKRSRKAKAPTDLVKTPAKKVAAKKAKVSKVSPAPDILEEKPKRVVDKVVPFQAIMLPDTITVIFNGKPNQIDKKHANYGEIKKIITENQKAGKIRSSKLEEIRLLIDVKAGLANSSKGRVTVDGQKVLIDGHTVVGRLANRLIAAVNSKNQKDIDRFCAFHTKIVNAKNSGKLIARLFDFVDQRGLGLHDDGDIIAFKVVRFNFKDKHTGTMDNSVGKIVTMPREQVNDNDNQTCSTGLHVCAPSYISSFGGGNDKLVACKVRPEDFVSIPTDYSSAKARTCRYEVISEVGNVKDFLAKYKLD